MCQKKCGALSAVHKHAVVTIVDKCIKTMFVVLAPAGSWVLAWANLSSFLQAPARVPVLRASKPVDCTMDFDDSFCSYGYGSGPGFLLQACCNSDA